VKTQPAESSQREKEIRLNNWLLPVFSGLFAILYALTGYRGWLVFFTGISLAWLLALAWVLILARKLYIRRDLHLAWATVGDSVHETLKIVNPSSLPAIWVEVMDASETLATPLRLVAEVEAHATWTRHPAHLCRRRGIYTLGPTRLRTGDPFGIFTLTIHDRHTSTILVTPPLLPLSGLRVTPGGWAGDQRRRRGVLGRDISEAGLRQYIPGDSLRRIHWPATAHQGDLMVRQLEAAASDDWWIFVDLDAGVQAGEGQDTTLELTVVLAASLAMRGLKERRRVGLVLAGPGLIRLEPRADPLYRTQILRCLSVAEKGDHSLADLLRFGRPAQPSTLIFISPTHEISWLASALRPRRGDNLFALLLDPREFGGVADQGYLLAKLAGSGIPYTRMPRSLLAEAYSSAGGRDRRSPAAVGAGRRYLDQGTSPWRSLG
jgi:uncharacterized protein (DUF58 family)